MVNMNIQLIPILILAPVVLELFISPALAADPLATWHVRQSPIAPTTEDFEGVAYGNGRWVIVGGKGTLLSSPDGVQWTAEVNPSGALRLDDVVFASERFVAIGSGNNLVLTSPDGRRWTKQTPKIGGGGVEIIHDGSRFITLLAGGFLTTSIDGAVWESAGRVPTRYTDIGAMTFGGGTYVEIGYKRTGQPTDLYSAASLSDWTSRDAASNENMFGVCYGLGQFVAVGMKGTLITSPDGATWTPRSVPHTGFIWDVCVGGDFFAAAGQWGRVLTSPNGVDWVRRETSATDHLTDIAFGNGMFVAVGWDGQIVQSDPIAAAPVGFELSQPMRMGDQFQFQFTGTVGQSYQVQATTDFINWIPMTAVTCTTSPMNCSLPGQGMSHRIYRVIQQ